MKRLPLLTLLAVTGLFTSCSSPNGPAAGKPIDLFNGKDLAGWRPKLADPAVKPETVWRVQDGILICKGEPLGYLGSAENYTDFRLEVEYRWAPGQKPGNSGLFARINDPVRPLPRCIEIQLVHGGAGDVLGLQGMKVSGDPTRYKEVLKHELAGDIAIMSRLVGNEQPAGEWNRVEALVKGGNVTVWFNGVKVNEASNAEILPGPVGLQSEGGEIHFRKVRLTPLD